MSFIQSRNALSCAVAGALALSGATLWHSPVKAAGFYIQEQSVSGLGRAFAGEAAVAQDSSTIFFNPAGMVFLPGTEVQAAVHLLVPKADVSDGGSTATTPGTGGAPLRYEGGSGGNPYDPTPVPNVFISHQHDERTWFGFGLTAPFGLANHYDDDFFARYDSTETDLKVLNLQPSMAYRLTDRLAIGGGIDIQYADATLKNAIPDPTIPGGPAVVSDGGETRLDADSWDYGFNLGLMWEMTDATRLGLHYRQGIKHTLDGKASVRNPPGLIPQVGEGFTEDGKADLHLPDMLALGVRQELNDRLTLMAQYKWFKWSNFDEIRVRFDSGRPDNVVEQNYKDSWALAVGAEYQVDDRWTLRGGLQYDRTPTQDGYRTTRTPDGDRTWYSLGASYEQGPNWGFDVAYTYIDISRESLDLERKFEAPNGDTFATIDLTGTTEGHVHILAAAVRYRF
ncbi:OmpP1/FadL family transporter [Ectothiorhodospira variabilis]|uniref:OmpP1/FadL family transporter n=1 Tax=Ectothiorhodospira variabilis TaxID=505694 RepID=UPI001EFA45CC|nr:porin [Ectothiorhodospira variabilis]MCG5494278.1 outer membrane protein transport protein [Ectothiorhodospira variabilis]MCG5504045.1 outer membrane protein transport protein [Ectothiorhodospira variabilis]MCG5507200.1 outer membrane protein transport protein [Ectothiorhodospira variabilis]